MDYSFLTQTLEYGDVKYTFRYRDPGIWEIDSPLCSRSINLCANVMWRFKRVMQCPTFRYPSTNITAVEFEAYKYVPVQLMKDTNTPLNPKYSYIKLKTPCKEETTIVSVFTIRIYLSPTYKGFLKYVDDEMDNRIEKDINSLLA